MLTFYTSNQPDVALIVAGVIRLHVSSEKLKAVRPFKRTFSKGFKEGEEFQAHQESGSRELFEHFLP